MMSGFPFMLFLFLLSFLLICVFIVFIECADESMSNKLENVFDGIAPLSSEVFQGKLASKLSEPISG